MARYVTVASIAFSAAPGQRPEAALAPATELLRVAARSHPDLVIFPEMFLHAGGPIEQWRGSEPLPNALSGHFAALARELQVNLLVPLPLMEEGNCFNGVVALSRQGEMLGTYAQSYSTPLEMQAGIIPGQGPAVFEFDFGRVSSAICFDLHFPHLAEALQEEDLDLLCVHSMFAGGDLLRAWAVTVGAPVLSSCASDSRLVDMTGAELGRVALQHVWWQLPPILIGRLNLDRRLFHIDHNIADYFGTDGGIHRLLAERPAEATLDYNLPMSLFALGAEEGVSLAALIDQYGLETCRDYFRRCRRLRDETRGAAGLSG